MGKNSKKKDMENPNRETGRKVLELSDLEGISGGTGQTVGEDELPDGTDDPENVKWPYTRYPPSHMS